jgi:hypothetical protein
MLFPAFRNIVILTKCSDQWRPVIQGRCPTCFEPPHFQQVILALIHVKYQFANNVKKQQHIIELIKPHTNLVSFFVFLSKAAPKYRYFSLDQCFLWWRGKSAENTERCAVIGSVFCHSRGHYIANKSKFKILAPWVLP